MPLVSIKEMLKRSQAAGYAVPLFDAFDSHSTDGMYSAAEERHAPVIVALYASAMDRPNADALASYIRTRAEGCNVPASFMLDHGRSADECFRAMDLGATDVMFDGSQLPYEENLQITVRVVNEARSRGVGVEAELGHVGFGKDYQEFGSKREGFTDPDDAVRFVKETGVDALAVAIGTAHGNYVGDPKLDLGLLKEIREAVDVPLVLHGGSGLSAEQFRSAIATGIAKVNVATDLYTTAGKHLSAFAAEESRSYHEFGSAAENSFHDRCGYYFDLFGASSKGGVSC